LRFQQNTALYSSVLSAYKLCTVSICPTVRPARAFPVTIFALAHHVVWLPSRHAIDQTCATARCGQTRSRRDRQECDQTVTLAPASFYTTDARNSEFGQSRRPAATATDKRTWCYRVQIRPYTKSGDQEKKNKCRCVDGRSVCAPSFNKIYATMYCSEFIHVTLPRPLCSETKLIRSSF